MALDSFGAAPELWDLFARAASNRAFQRERVQCRQTLLPEPPQRSETLFARAASNRAFQREHV